MGSAKQLVQCDYCKCSVNKDSAYEIEGVDPIDVGRISGYITVYVCDDCMDGGDGSKCEGDCSHVGY
jgi:hypothetical protein